MKKKTMIQAFEWYINHEDAYYKNMLEKVKLIKALGIDQVWLPPAFKGQKGIHDSGYGVYDLYDLGAFDQKGTIETKYGHEADYLKLIEAIKKADLELIVDVVLNHRLGADATERVLAKEVDMDNRYLIKDTKEIEAWTRFDFEGRNNQYSDFKWNKNHFKAVDFDVLNQKNAIYLFEDKSWDLLVDSENFNYDYLMGADVDFYNEAVQEELLRWMVWYYELTGFNGVRLDAIKHIDARFLKVALRKLRELNSDIFAVGEYWSGDLKSLHDHLMDTDFSMQLFDVPLHYNLVNASENPNFDLRTLYNGTIVSNNPNFSVTFVDNHDTQVGQSLESWVQGWFKLHAYAFILLRDVGIPSVFYADLFGSNHETMPAVKNLDKILYLRKDHMVGSFFDYMDEPHTIGWCFTGDETGEGFVSVLNINDRTMKRMFVGVRNAGGVFVDCLSDDPKHVTIDQYGIGYFPVEKRSLSVYVKKEGNYSESIL